MAGDEDEFEWLQNEDPQDRGEIFRQRYERKIIDEFVANGDTEWLENEDPCDRGQVLRERAWKAYNERGRK